jgi:hypothetical protein
MNIRKHLNRILLASTAIFWASCNDDAQSSNPTAAPTSSISSEAVTSSPTVASESSSSSEVQQQDDMHACRETEKIVKQEFDTDIMNNPEAYATLTARKNAERRAQLSIRDSAELATARIEKELLKAFDDSLDMNNDTGVVHLSLSLKCLHRMLDTLASPVFLYGVPPNYDSIATKLECDDGTTYIRDEYLRYQEELEKYEKKYATFEETYTESFKRIKEKREAELKDLMDSCINRPEDFPLFDEDEEEIDEDSSPE